MENQTKEIEANILGRTYHFRCPVNKIDSLNIAINFLETRLETIQKEYVGMNFDSILVITMLNIIDDFLVKEKNNSISQNEISSEIKQLQNRIFEILDK